jgi:hypothetical protein
MLDGLNLYDLKFDGFGFVGFDVLVVGGDFVVGVDVVGMDFVGVDVEIVSLVSPCSPEVQELRCFRSEIKSHGAIHAKTRLSIC